MKHVFIWLSILILSISLVNASISGIIEVNKEFGYGDIIKFNYTLLSEDKQSIIFIGGARCPYLPSVSLLPLTENISSQDSLSGEYIYMKVDNNTLPQTCTAYVKILGPFEQIFEKEFSINTTPSIDLKIIFNKIVYVKNEKAIIDYESSVGDLSILAYLTSPNGKTGEISLPATVDANQIGTYSLDVTASKEGYKDVKITKQFGVIEKNANIGYEKSTTPNPLEGFNKEQKNNIFYIYLILISIVIILIVLIRFILMKMKTRV